MALSDVTSATKFVKALAGNNKIRVSFIPGLKVPTADMTGHIKLPPPTIDKLGDWNHSVHHELSHCIPAHRYHFDAVKELHKKHGKKYNFILNVVVDNLAERFEYERYEGRRRILSKGLFDLMKSRPDWFEPAQTKDEHLIKGLVAWDCNQRTKWMGYPMNQFLSPIDKFKDVFDYLEEIDLEGKMIRQDNAEHLVYITEQIAKFTEQEPEDDGEGDGSGSGDDSPESQEPDGDGNADEHSEPSEDSGGSSESGDSDEDGEGSEGDDSPDDNSGNGSGSDDKSDNVPLEGDGDVDDKADDGDDKDGVGGESQKSEETPESDGGTDDSSGDSERSEEGNSKQDEDGSDCGSADKASSSEKPLNPGKYDEQNVSEKTKAIMRAFLMQDEVNPDPDGRAYVPITCLHYIPLSESPWFNTSAIEGIVGNSKVSKSIQKYLQAMNARSYQYGMNQGRIANRSVFKTQSGSTKVFRQRNAQRIQQDTAIMIMLDCSGSMQTYVKSINSKMEIAMASVAILAETLNSLRIPYEVLGYTEDVVWKVNEPDEHGGVQMYEFKNFGENLNRTKIIERLCSIPATNNNADAESLLEGVSRLNRREEVNKIMIVLSDGNPVGNFDPGKWEAIKYLQEVCKHIEQDTDIDLMGIGICTNAVREYYTNYQVIDDPSTLNVALMEMLKKKIVGR